MREGLSGRCVGHGLVRAWAAHTSDQQPSLFLSTVFKSETLRVDWTRSHNEVSEKKKEKLEEKCQWWSSLAGASDAALRQCCES